MHTHTHVHTSIECDQPQQQQQQEKPSTIAIKQNLNDILEGFEFKEIMPTMLSIGIYNAAMHDRQSLFVLSVRLCVCMLITCLNC